MIKIIIGVVIGLAAMFLVKLIWHLVKKIISKRFRTETKLNNNIDKTISAEAKIINANAAKNRAEFKLIIKSTKEKIFKEYEDAREKKRKDKLRGKKFTISEKIKLSKFILSLLTE